MREVAKEKKARKKLDGQVGIVGLHAERCRKPMRRMVTMAQMMRRSSWARLVKWRMRAAWAI